MFLEEMCLAIHMRAVKYTITIDLFIRESRGFLRGQIRVALIPQIILMGLKVIFLRFLLLIEFLLMLCISLIESTLKFAKAIREVAKDVGATDLHKGLISGLQEYHELFVHVPKQMIAQH
jgi:hypothetical protein